MLSLIHIFYVHSLNVSLICRQIGKWIKADDATLDMLTLAGLLHDIGKLKIPTELLNKPGKYTDEEDVYKRQLHIRARLRYSESSQPSQAG